MSGPYETPEDGHGGETPEDRDDRQNASMPYGEWLEFVMLGPMP